MLRDGTYVLTERGGPVTCDVSRVTKEERVGSKPTRFLLKTRANTRDQSTHLFTMQDRVKRFRFSCMPPAFSE